MKINNLFCGVGGRMARKIFRLNYKKLKSEGGIGADYISIDEITEQSITIAKLKDISTCFCYRQGENLYSGI